MFGSAPLVHPPHLQTYEDEFVSFVSSSDVYFEIGEFEFIFCLSESITGLFVAFSWKRKQQQTFAVRFFKDFFHFCPPAKRFDPMLVFKTQNRNVHLSSQPTSGPAQTWCRHKTARLRLQL